MQRLFAFGSNRLIFISKYGAVDLTELCDCVLNDDLSCIKERIINGIGELTAVSRHTDPHTGAKIYRLYDSRIADLLFHLIKNAVDLRIIGCSEAVAIQHRNTILLQHHLGCVFIHAKGRGRHVTAYKGNTNRF